MPRTLTLTEAADMLHVHVDTVSDLIRHQGNGAAAYPGRLCPFSTRCASTSGSRPQGGGLP